MVKSVKELIEPAITATEAGKMKWESDPTGGYLVAMNSYVLNVYNAEESGDEAAQDGYGIRIVNRGNEVIDHLFNNKFKAHYPQLKRLYEIAKRSALNIDNAIEDVLKQIGRL